MNIDSKTLNKTNQPAETTQNAAASACKNVSQQPAGKSFKGELNAIKATDSKVEQDVNFIAAQMAAQVDTQVLQQAAVMSSDGSEYNTGTSFGKKVLSGKSSISKALGASGESSLSTSANVESNLFEPLNELNSKIATISELKKDSFKAKMADKEEIEISLNYNVIKMDRNDALFFANLVNGDNLTAQKSDAVGTEFSEIKSDATQASSQVSATLMDSLSESMKTNKPFRIDFDKDIAVILRVDKEGKVSAEFIPGDKAVEQYLKNNIPLLKESFDKQNLPYNELNYQRQKQQNQQQQRNRKENKEKDDE